jgi:hypothetical protein
MRTDHKVLVIALDPLLAALLGALVERVGMRAAFPEPGEIADSALDRVRPIAAILLDSKTGEAQSELFLARASKKKTPVIMFGPKVSAKRAEELAKNSIRSFALPEQIDAIQKQLEEIAGIGAAHRVQAASGRRRPHADVGPNGALVFFDESGQRWAVYDRRGKDRRNAQREFVSEAGVSRLCDVLDSEVGATSVDILAAQLSRATASA